MRKAAILTNQLFAWDNSDIIVGGGGERFAIRLANLLIKTGFEAHIFQYSPTPFIKRIGDIYVHGIRDNRIACNCFRTGVCDVFYRATEDFDNVIINMPEMTGGAVRDDAILITHSTYWCGRSGETLTGIKKKYMFDAFHNAAKNVVVHPFTIETMRKAGFDEIADRTICIDNCVDTDIFKPGEKEKIILFPGRAEKMKGADLIEGILQDLDLPDWKVIWCGDGNYAETLKLLEGKHKNFSIINLPQDEAHMAYATASICVVMNLISRGNSLALMEGMASECACIGINGGTTLINDCINGILCQPEQILASIKRLAGNCTLRKELGKQARLDMIAGHSPAVWERKWINLIGE